MTSTFSYTQINPKTSRGTAQGAAPYGLYFSPKDFGFGNRRIEELSDIQFASYSQQLQKAMDRNNQIEAIKNNRTNTGSQSRNTNAGYGSDWNNDNPNFSWDSMKTMAKDLAQQQIDQAEKMMGLSYGYRTKEKGLDSEIRQREAQQRFGFEEALENMRNSQQLKIQENQFGQERTMFDRQDTAENNRIRSARRAANNLFYGGRNRY